LKKDARKRLQIRVHGAVPFGSAILIDSEETGGKIQIEVKPYKMGLRNSFAYEIQNKGQPFFQVMKNSYFNLVRDGTAYDDIKSEIERRLNDGSV
jgi:hypothetical protein